MKIKRTPSNKATHLLFYVLACAFGTIPWLISLLLLIAGWATTQGLGIALPAWTAVFAFVLGLPIGAVLELKFSGVRLNKLR